MMLFAAIGLLLIGFAWGAIATSYIIRKGLAAMLKEHRKGDNK